MVTVVSIVSDVVIFGAVVLELLSRYNRVITRQVLVRARWPPVLVSAYEFDSIPLISSTSRFLIRRCYYGYQLGSGFIY